MTWNLSDRPGLALACISIASLALRLFLALTHDNMLGVDGGAYILSARDVLGESVRHLQDFTRPPLAPGYTLVPFIKLWGFDIGFKVWSALAATTTIPAMYYLAQRFTSRRTALWVALFASVNMLHAEMFVTGALPLIGFSLIAIAVSLMAKLVHDHEFAWRRLALLGAVVGLIPFVNQTSAGLAAIILPLYLAGLWATRITWPGLVWPDHLVKSVAVRALYIISSAFAYSLSALTSAPGLGLMLGLLIGIGALPWYMDVVIGGGNLKYDGPMFYLAPIRNWGWAIAFLGVPLGAFVTLKATDFRMKALGPLIMLLSLTAPVWSYDESIMNLTFRGRYLVMMFVYPASAWALAKLRDWLNPSMAARYSFATLAVLFSLLSYQYVASFHRQAEISDQITTDTMPALAALRVVDPESAIINNTFSMAWWIGALNDTKAPTIWNARPPEKWRVEDVNVRCVLGWIDGCDPYRSAKLLGARWVLVDTSFPERNETVNYGAPPRQWEVTARAPWLELVYESGATRMWKVN